MKKFFLICLAILLSIQGAASAKTELSEEDRISIAIEVTDSSRHQDLDTADSLENFLIDKLGEKNLVNVVDTKIFMEEEMIFDEDSTTEKKSSLENLGKLLVFDAVELPVPSERLENFEQTFYKNLGAKYVVRCEVLALGLTKVEDKTLSTIFGASGGVTALIGSGSGSTNKTLRRVGTAVGMGGFIQTQRTALNTVVNMQFISVETGEILWQEHFTGKGIKHKKPRKGYDNVWEQAYNDSVEKTAKIISQRVNKYVDKVIVKGKNDKSFRLKSPSDIGGKLF